MPPVLNTYGATKKKRRGVLKYLCQDDAESVDLFDALKIEKIKETKAIVQEKKKKRKPKETSSKNKTAAPKIYVRPPCLDTTFDRLLREGPVRGSSYSDSDCSSSEQTSSSSGSSSSSSLELIRRPVQKPLESKVLQEKRRILTRRIGEVSPSLVNCVLREKFNGMLKDTKVTQRNSKKSSQKENNIASEFNKHKKITKRKIQRKRKSLSLDNDSFFAPRKVSSPPLLNTEVKPCRFYERSFDREFVFSSTPSIFKPERSPDKEIAFSSTPSICKPERSPDKEIAVSTTPSVCKPIDSSKVCSQIMPISPIAPMNSLFSSEAPIALNSFCSPDLSRVRDGPTNQSSHDMFDTNEIETNCSNFESVTNTRCQSTPFACKASAAFNCYASPDLFGSMDCSAKAQSKSNASFDVCDTLKMKSKNLSANSKHEDVDKSKSVSIIDVTGSDSSKCSNITGCSTVNMKENGSSRELCTSPSSSLRAYEDQTQSQKCDAVSEKLGSSYIMTGQTSIHNNVTPCKCKENILSEKSQESLHSPLNDNVGRLNGSDVVSDFCKIISTSLKLKDSKEQECSEVCDSDVSSSIFVQEDCEVIPSQVDDGLAEPSENSAVVCPSIIDHCLPCGRPVSENVTCPVESYIASQSPCDTKALLNMSRECQVLLSRCDVTDPCNVILDRSELGLEVNHCEGPILKSSQSDQVEQKPVVLKPGKQWRRSLSIVSKFRLSDGGRKSLSLSEAKGKGRNWQTSVNSIIQMQPPEALCEEDEIGEDSVFLDSFGGSKLESMSQVEPGSAALVYKRCAQTGPVPFDAFYPESMKKKCKKLGEGVYGEVFAYSGKRGRKSCVIKIIPIEGQMEVNGEPQKTFAEILSEVCVAQELSNLRNGVDDIASTFNEVQAIRCVQGRYPDWLVNLWCDYNEAKGSENDCPDIFHEDQLYIVLELSNGGQDLESFVFNSAVQGFAAFKQIAVTLAVGESALSFEHRDLHWGNVLISNTRDKEIQFMLDGEPISLPSEGVQVSIIDFTMSRITDPSTNQSIYYDLAKDETLFTAHGDYQFEIYRMMKNYCENQWAVFSPKTNVAWLHYLSDKLCTMARYHNRKSVAHMNAIESLVEIKESLLSFPSVKSFVQSYFYLN